MFSRTSMNIFVYTVELVIILKKQHHRVQTNPINTIFVWLIHIYLFILAVRFDEIFAFWNTSVILKIGNC